MNINDSEKKEYIKWAYRLFLDRDCENDKVYNTYNDIQSTQDIRDRFLSCEEYENKISINDRNLLNIDTTYDNKLLEKLFQHVKESWTSLGKQDLYYYVITNPLYKKEILTERELNNFYNMGNASVNYFEKRLADLSINFDKSYSCLEFGCGVGRITHALAKRFKSIYAYDISKQHIETAIRYHKKNKIENTVFSILEKYQDIQNIEKTDLIYTTLVLQHNPPPLIVFIIDALLKSLKCNGIAFLQVLTYIDNYSFDTNKYLKNKEISLEMHALPQKEIHNIIYRNNSTLLELTNSGTPDKTISSTFIIKKNSV